MTATEALRRERQFEIVFGGGRSRASRSIEGFFQSTIENWRADGLIEAADFSRNDERDIGVLRLHLGREVTLEHTITSAELTMGGTEAVRAWLRAVGTDIVRVRARHGLPERNPRRRVVDMGANLDRTVNPPLIFDEATQVQIRQMYGHLTLRPGGINWVADEAVRADLERERREADEKAEQLFIRSAGEEAFRHLEAGKPLAVRGSAGGKYHLHKRSTFCVTRLHDGAQMCAVVPGVPLYDHLLGIKLVIETDEPRFIKTANVSGGGIMPGGVAWVPSGVGMMGEMTTDIPRGYIDEMREQVNRAARDAMLYGSGAIIISSTGVRALDPANTNVFSSSGR